MQIVIDIDDDLYTRLFDNGVDNYDDAVDMAKAIRKGVLLPKGHGRLVDADEIEHYMLPSEKQDKRTWFVHSEEYRNAVIHFNHALGLLRDNAPTIIEADKVESEG